MDRDPPRPDEEAALSLSGLAKRYGKTQALNGVDLKVNRGDIYGFLGRNGAGKSTTIKILAGLVRPDRGALRLLGIPQAASDHRIRSRVGFLIEHPAFYPHLNAMENLKCHIILQGRRGKEAMEDGARCLERVGLAEAAVRKVGEYSTGMRQRLGLAQAFLGDPDLIVLDEPWSGLDPDGIYHMREIIRERARTRGTTFFISSHILAEVEQLCNRVGFIAYGRTVAEGTLDALGATGWVHLRVSDPERAGSAIAKRWPGETIRTLKDGGLDLRLKDSQIPDLVRLLVEERIDVYSVGRKSRSLEEIFMERTREGP